MPEVHNHLNDLHQYDNISDEELEKLSDDMKWRIEHHKMHDKHKGHEAMHSEMLLVLIVTLIIAQIILLQWKKRHFKSYQLITLIFMWITPIIFCIQFHWFRFIIVWLLFTLISSTLFYRSSRKQIDGSTPRLVYRWFFFIYQASYICGIAGYILIILTLFGFNLIVQIKHQTTMDLGFVIIFYAIYFGVIGRDFAEVCSEKLAVRIGYYSKNGLPSRYLDEGVCAVCGNEVHLNIDTEKQNEKTFQLNCNHMFHEFCIRGWCIVGKKETCPYCNEKVDLKRMFPTPWERPHMMYAALLDWVRYLVTWQPVIILIVQGINYGLGLS